MRILLLGANGQLGRTFLDQGGLAARGELVAASRDGALTHGGPGEIADLSIPASLPALLDRVRPDVIVNAAAYTAVDRAEQEEALATRVNGEAVGVLGRWAAAHGALVIHYSTDYVFDGRQSQPYAVDATTGPLGAYGRSKLAGERALRDSGADHLTFRTAWVYAAHGHNFLRTMLRLGAERDELRVVADQHGAPTSTALIVAGTLAALDAWQAAEATQRRTLIGTHHLVASGHTSWHGFAEAIFADAAGRGLIARAPRVAAITTADYPTPAERPAWSLLDNTGFQRRFGYALPDWQSGLHDVLDALSRQRA
ncbi:MULTISPECIES: dTDP-4-dehydrorhamnose reductase [Rhodanobacter]|uniref:dTDP-4-dehydrorhamnose reductase n=1 Tax=Rhodanobacter TaxID=75309 RepID=UPI00047F7BF9|nr:MULTISPECIES: dTDP-4-dehydrorhamnose reductase [Rhodanobacter]KZC21362.1 NAD(P)-dependent oxidoreductase [Rhodanobacter denitrificans]UJJ51640.1 dTDP-4-dehydrorhamnose reductase [Rhodanobacter denitrificans]UJM94384.1 dTDP-4-dehydrorhamnose reductase [Rhodanobacter denitrificans]UJM97914.1 dTDP-4-dehydrorhamnose reductase [Rhodanobacter denitrificans]UJN22672.1 dTDP-4-dehydrorhamnose reductase [Rhodanobacter denitrificans]